MKALEGIANIHVHSSIHRLNEAISSTGLILPETQLLEIDDKKALENQIVIVPPALFGTNMIKNSKCCYRNLFWLDASERKKTLEICRCRFCDFGSRRLERIITNGKIYRSRKVYVTHGSTEIFLKIFK